MAQLKRDAFKDEPVVRRPAAKKRRQVLDSDESEEDESDESDFVADDKSI